MFLSLLRRHVLPCRPITSHLSCLHGHGITTAPISCFSTVELPLCSNSPPVKLHAFWLRDHCRCSQCWHPITKQRLVDTAKIPKAIQVTLVQVTDDDNVFITWSDGHTTSFNKHWLLRHAYYDHPQYFSRHQELEAWSNQVKLWGNDISITIPSVEYDDIMDSTIHDLGVLELLHNIIQYGFSFVKNVPVSVEKTKALAERIAYIRETHYGTYWDFTSNLQHGDTAYTSLALPAHTDTTYFTDPIGLQLFHLMQFSGSGGESLLVDGFHIASQLRQQDPHAYKVLRDTKVGSHCAGDKDTYIYPHPRYQSMFTELPLSPMKKKNGIDADEPGVLIQVRYNNNDRSILNHLTYGEVEQYYDALLKWQTLLTQPHNEYWFAQQPGTVVIVDNHRVLHGRGAFTGTDRRLTGCYINGDDWRSRYRTLRKTSRMMC